MWWHGSRHTDRQVCSHKGEQGEKVTDAVAANGPESTWRDAATKKEKQT